ncbi:MAG TPA: hypothetical protein VMO47_03270 [Rhodothermales bacterium]|nr:hypothetical protein [Rhodothermales bacterium]
MSTISIPTPPDFRYDATMMSHGWIMLEPFAHDEELTELQRILQTRSGRVLRVAIRNAGGKLDVDVSGRVSESQGLSEADRKDVTVAVRHIFNLDLDLSDFYRSLRGVDRYEWVERRRAGRLLRSPTVWEDLAKTLMTTNTTWAMTTQMVRRLCRLGDPYDENLFAFPPPERIASMSRNDLSEQVRAGYRNAYLHELAESIASGKVDPESWAGEHLPTDELRKRVRSLKGFGPYAAGTILKLLGSFDELALDSAARTMFTKEFSGGVRPHDRDIASHYESYGEWRGLVIWMDLLREWFEARVVPPLE